MGKKKSAKASTPPPDQSPETIPLSESPAFRTFQGFERLNVLRSTLHFHESNPRQIDPHAAKKLRESIKRNKLLTSLIVNRRLTANGFDEHDDGKFVIVGGHQRCRWGMDALAGYDYLHPDPSTDYMVPIDLIEVPPGREKEILIALNNPALQGTWDQELLADLLMSPDVSPLDTGFDRIDLSLLLDEGQLAQIMGETAGSSAATAQAAADAPILNDIAEVAASRQSTRDRSPSPIPAGPAAPASPFAATPSDPSHINSVESIKGRREKFQERAAADQAPSSSQFFITLIANSDEEIAALCRALDLPFGQQFYDLSAFLDRAGLGEILASPLPPENISSDTIDETLPDGTIPSVEGNHASEFI